MSLEQDNLIPISPFVRVNELRRVLGTIAHRSNNGEFTLVKKQGWLAVPLESGYHLDVLDQAHLLKAILGQGSKQMWAVSMEALENFPSAFSVSIDPDGIRTFNQQCGHFNFALFADEPSWVVIFSTDDYFIIVGPPDFVHTAAGGDAGAVFSNFQAFATDSKWPQEVSSKLLSVYKALKNEYTLADPDELVHI